MPLNLLRKFTRTFFHASLNLLISLGAPSKRELLIPQELSRELERGREALADVTGHADARIDSIHSVHCATVSGGKTVRSQDVERVGIGLRLFDSHGEAFVAEEGDIDWSRSLSKARALAVLGKPFIATADVLYPPDAMSSAQLPADHHTDFDLPGPEWLLDLKSTLRRQVGSWKLDRLSFSGRRGWRGIVRSDGFLALRAEHDLHLSATCSLATGRQNERWVVSLSAGSSMDLPSLEVQMQEMFKYIEGIKPRVMKRASWEADCPVVLAPAVAGLLIHEAIGHPAEADRIPDQYRDKLRLGLKIGPSNLTITDRGDVAESRGSLPFDDEGVPCRPTPLVITGHWVGLLHSRRTAARDGTGPTGNARTTSFRYPPVCRMRVTEVQAGAVEPSVLLVNSDDALYLDWPQFGQVRGAVIEIRAFAWRILGGQLDEFLGPVVLHHRPLAVLADIDAIGSDSQIINSYPGCTRGEQKRLTVGMIAPTMRIRQASVKPIV